jgi:hypothetical protein
MTCRAPLLAELLAVTDAAPPVDAPPCDGPIAYSVVVEHNGIELSGDTCREHALLIAARISGDVRLIGKRI